MAARLVALNFQTTLKLDVTRRDLYDALDAALGHSIQTEAGRNCLISSDSHVEKTSPLRTEGEGTNTLLELTEKSANLVSILILDAGRDNSLPGGDRSAGRGNCFDVAVGL